jgi:acetyl-CoA carboxylase carboxyltransferase component
MRRVYDVRDVITAVVDAGRFLEVSPKWARNMVVGFARLVGQVVGVVANQPRSLGGVIDVAGSRKGAAFVGLCSDYGVPLVVLVDTPGFMPGVKQEAAGVIGQGATLVRSFAAATVPRATVILRKAYGGAYIAMNSKSLGADVVAAWRGAQLGVMGARAAAQVIHRREIAAAHNPEAQLDRLARAYAHRHMSAAAAARRGMIDTVIDPAWTRDTLATAIQRGSAGGATSSTISGNPAASGIAGR